jgi:hypothetical protein
VLSDQTSVELSLHQPSVRGDNCSILASIGMVCYSECVAVTFVNIGQYRPRWALALTQETLFFILFLFCCTHTTTINTINTGGAERTRKPRRREKCHQPPTLGIRRVFPHATFKPSEVRRGFNNRHVCGGARCV